MTMLSKATVLVLLPITLAFSAGVMGHPLPEHETMTKPPQSDTFTPISAKRPASAPLEPIVFAETEDYDALLKSYPFLEQLVKEVADGNATGVMLVKSSIKTASFKDDKLKANLLFINIFGSDYCGSAGCPMHVFSDNGTGYKLLMTTSITEPIFISRDDKSLSIVDCTGDGPRQLVFSNGAFTQQKPVSTAATKACPPPEP